jgi:hypothetical protein
MNLFRRHPGIGAATALGPDLSNAQWRWGDGSYGAIATTITAGVA